MNAIKPMPSHAPTDPQEAAFQQWYAQMAQQHSLSPDPDSQPYDYRAAFRAGAKPDASGHWPSDFKKRDHPAMVVGGFHVQTGERVPGTPRATSVAQLVDLGWDPETARQLMAVPEPLMPSHSIRQHAEQYGPVKR